MASVKADEYITINCRVGSAMAQRCSSFNDNKLREIIESCVKY